jgi:hypothetical protein
VDVGVLKLKPETNTWLHFVVAPIKVSSKQRRVAPEIFYKHYGMVKAWSEVQKAGEVDFQASFRQYLRKVRVPLYASQHEVRPFLQQCKLPIWCRLLDLARQGSSSMTNGGQGPGTAPFEAEFLLKWGFDGRGDPRGELNSWLPRPVRELSVEVHGEAAVSKFCRVLLVCAYGRFGRALYPRLLDL